MSRRINRVEEACKEELSEIIQREIKDPRIGFVTITRVKVSADLRHARVYVSVMGSDEEVARSLDGLNSARGYLRSHLGKNLRLKYFPEIEIVHERITEQALRLNAIMDQNKLKYRSATNKVEIEKAAGLIEDHKSVIILAHQNPDGDAIGSMLGLGLMLEGAGYSVQCSWPDPFKLPAKYHFLKGKELLIRPENINREDLLITVDCANTDRLEDFRGFMERSTKILNIDHHLDNNMFGSINIVDPKAAATAEIIYVAHRDLGLDLDTDSAECLYMGIVTDTGRFQFSNTSSVTLQIASQMVEMGVDPTLIYENIYQSDSLSYLRLTGQILDCASFDEKLGLIHAVITLDELKRWRVKMEETEDLIDNLRTLKGHRIAALFKELEDGRFRISLRSKADIDIGSVARRLGGGGHKVAAAYTSGKESLREALAELKDEIIRTGWNRDS